MAKTAKNTVLTKEEVSNLTSLQQQQNDLIYNLGQTEYQLEFFGNRKKIWKGFSKSRKRRIY